MNTWNNLEKKDNNKTIRWWKIKNRQASYFDESSKVYTAISRVCSTTRFSALYQHDNKKWDFFPTFLSPLTSSLQSQSQLRYTNTHTKDELEDEHSHNQITREKEQETEENSFLVKNKNISELRKFQTTASKKKT